MTTKWDLISEAERAALDAVSVGTSCSKCGVALATEGDAARHFVIQDARVLNVGNCPVSPQEWPMWLSQGNAWRFKDLVPVIDPDAEGRNGFCYASGLKTTHGEPTFDHARDFRTGRCSCGAIDVPWPADPEEIDDRPHGEEQPIIDAIESRADYEYEQERALDPGDPYDDF